MRPPMFRRVSVGETVKVDEPSNAYLWWLIGGTLVVGLTIDVVRHAPYTVKS